TDGDAAVCGKRDHEFLASSATHFVTHGHAGGAGDCGIRRVRVVVLRDGHSIGAGLDESVAYGDGAGVCAAFCDWDRERVLGADLYGAETPAGVPDPQTNGAVARGAGGGLSSTAPHVRCLCYSGESV